MTTPRAPLAADLFCGSGSVSAALKAAGFSVTFGIDNDAAAVATYKVNHPQTSLFCEDIKQVSLENAATTLRGGARLSVLAVCAPCQPFSSQNRKRGAFDERASLVLEAVRFAQYFRPETIWVENVPGIARSSEKDQLRGALASLGYKFGQPLRIEASALGVPQRRVRSIFVATLSGDVLDRVEKFRTEFSGDLPSTVRQAFRGLQRLGPGEYAENDPLHFARRHAELTVARLRAIPIDGGSRSALPKELQLSCHASLGNNSFPDVYGRMAWDAPSPTLTTGCTDVTRGRFAHPEEDRAISLREAARLQSFPDSYSFVGRPTEIARLIGNAVPYEMARRMFRWLFFAEWPTESHSP